MEPRRSPRRTVRHPRRLLALAFVGIGLVGALLWVVNFSPFGFERITAGGGARAVDLGAPGEYAVLEQRSAAAPGVTAVVVQSRSGIQIAVDSAGSGGAVQRDRPGFAAWEVARFTIDEPGQYTVFAIREDTGGTGSSPTLAITRVSSLGWQGSWLGLAVMAALPLLFAGLVAFGPVARWRRKTRGEGHPAAVDEPSSGSLIGHDRT